jgi:hypothetical protein
MPKSYPLRAFLSRSKLHKRETNENNPRTLYAGASPRMIWQNTQLSSPPSPSPPPAAPPPAHVEVETDHAAASAGCRSRSSPGGAGSSGRRWERSTASRRGIEDDIWSWGGSGTVVTAMHTAVAVHFWDGRITSSATVNQCSVISYTV